MDKRQSEQIMAKAQQDKEHVQAGEEPCSELHPQQCTSCAKQLCLRQQVINLALGKAEDMLCLSCLGRDNEQDPESVLSGIRAYVLSRACFKKEWNKYTDVSFCPEPDTCFPDTCFAACDEE